MWVVLLVALVLAVSYWAMIMYQGYIFPRKVKAIRELIDSQRYAEAKAAVDKLPASQRDDPMAKWLLAKANIAEGQYILAMVALQDILKRRRYTADLKEYQIHEGLAYCYEKTGRLKESILELQFAVHLKPDHFDSLYTLGKLYFEQRNYQIAESYLSRAIKINSRNPHIYFLLGTIAAAQKDIKRGIDMFTMCTVLDPNFYKAHKELGRLYYDLKDFVRAQKNFTIAKANAECYRESIIYEGLSLFGMHEFEGASEVLKEALATIPENDRFYLTVLESLAECYLKLRNVNEVRIIWESILKVSPIHPEAKGRMALFRHIFNSNRLASFFSLPDEKYEMFVRRFLEQHEFYVEALEVRSGDEIIVQCQKNKMGQMKFAFILLFTRKPKQISVEEELRELFILIKNRHATQAYVITPFDFHEECFQFITSRPVELITGERFAAALDGEDIF